MQTWQDALDAKTTAAKLRADAQQRAATKHVSIADAETLTVAGHWTIDQFNTFLESPRLRRRRSGVPRSARAGSHHEANGRGDGDKEHRGVEPRERAHARAGSSAVVLGVEPLTTLQAWLVSAGYTADAITALVAETQTMIDTADAARARRTSTPTAADGRPPALAEVTRAARLGLVTPADYQAALEARGLHAGRCRARAPAPELRDRAREGAGRDDGGDDGRGHRSQRTADPVREQEARRRRSGARRQRVVARRRGKRREERPDDVMTPSSSGS